MEQLEQLEQLELLQQLEQLEQLEQQTLLEQLLVYDPTTQRGPYHAVTAGLLYVP